MGARRESREGEGLARDFRRKAEEEEHFRPGGQKETGSANGNSWCAGDPCWLHTPLPGRREDAVSLCESLCELNVPMHYVSVSPYSSVALPVIVCGHPWVRAVM